jgi:calpain-15
MGGKKTPVQVDDWIPVMNGKPLSVDSKSEELWCILLEKAWAKLHGSYQRIEGGLPSNALFAITGKPSWRHIHKYTENLFTLIKSYEDRDFVMVAGTSGSGENEIENSGIAGGHAYSLLSAHSIRDKNNRKVELVKLRNPWGNYEWKGDWSDNDSDNWTS